MTAFLEGNGKLLSTGMAYGKKRRMETAEKVVPVVTE